MKIGIDAHVLGKKLGGVERFVSELVKALPKLTPEHQYIIFVTKDAHKTMRFQSTRQVTFVPLAFANPMLERLILLPWLVWRYRLDALLVQRLAPWFCGNCKLIVTIHDLTPIKFKDAYKGLSNRLVRLLTKNTILRADLILTPTNAIKAEIEAYAPKASAPIRAFYNGVDVDKFKKNVASQPQVEPPYLLTVGAIERRKNLETIIAALAQLNNSALHLYILGGIRDQAYFDEIQQQIAALNLINRVHYLGFLDEETLISRYQNARVFITSSRDEGFNIPPLEAMACDVPVICSDIAVHRELFENAALFYVTESAQDLAGKITQLMQDSTLSHQLTIQGKQKAHFFNWSQTATNVAKALREVT